MARTVQNLLTFLCAVSFFLVLQLNGAAGQGRLTRGCKKDIVLEIRRGATMIGVDFIKHERQTYQQCLAKCRAKTTPAPDHCFGVEYHASTRECRLMKKGMGSQTGWRAAPLWFHFERYCLQVKAYTSLGGLFGPLAIKMGQADFMVCSSRLWTRNAAKATCKNFGFQDGIPVTHQCNMPFELGLIRPENRSFHKISCTGREASLLDCRGELDGNPCPRDQYASVKCFQQPLVQDNMEKALDLHLYNASSRNWGMVKVRHLGHWAGVCEFTDREAKVVCEQRGFKDGIALFASKWDKPTAAFGLKEPVYAIRKMICPRNAQNIQSCALMAENDVCPVTPYCHTNGFAHVLCTTRPAYDGDIRLTGGTPGAGVGRVEFRFEGTWGTILANDHWTPVEATVVCAELGYKYGVPMDILTAASSKPVWLSDVHCYGHETEIIRCRLARGWNRHHPLSLAGRRDAGVTCGDNVVFRLVGGGAPNKGRVELNVPGSNAEWGTVCTDLWSDLDTKVLCKQLGFLHGGKVLPNNPFGRGAGDILLDEVQCDGSEANILDCKHKPFGVHNCTHYRELTVECNTNAGQAQGGANPSGAVNVADPNFIFTRLPQNITTEVGSSRIIFQCKTNKLSVIKWFLNGRRINPSESTSGFQLYRGGVLLIRNIKRNHAGMYTCEGHRVGEGEVIIRAHAWLKIPNFNQEECRDYLNEEPENITARVQSTILFKCFAEFAQNITWVKDGAPVVPDIHREVLVNGYLKIHEVARRDEGVYTCKAVIKTPDNDICRVQAKAKLTVFNDLNIVCGRPIVNQPRISQDESRGYIIGGREARPGSSPWQAMLTLRSKRWQPACGGVIIHESLIATAAHCIRNPQANVQTAGDIKVKVGKHMRTRPDHVEVLHRVAAILVHDDFDRNNFDNDIALLRLQTPMTFTDYIRPICVGDTALLARLVSPGRYGTLTGWGQLDNAGGLPNALNEVRLPVVNRTTCARSTTYPFTGNMFCAGFGQATRGDSCKGDSGGPFSVKDAGTDRWYLGGLVSWGDSKGCGLEGKYGYYTKVQNYIAWLRDQIFLADLSI